MTTRVDFCHPHAYMLHTYMHTHKYEQTHTHTYVRTFIATCFIKAPDKETRLSTDDPLYKMLRCFPLLNHCMVPGMNSSQKLTYLREQHSSKIKMQAHQGQNAPLYKAPCERNQHWQQKSGWYLLVTETGTGSIGGLFLLIHS